MGFNSVFEGLDHLAGHVVCMKHSMVEEFMEEDYLERVIEGSIILN
jgi:hypothetical protein